MLLLLLLLLLLNPRLELPVLFRIVKTGEASTVDGIPSLLLLNSLLPVPCFVIDERYAKILLDQLPNLLQFREEC
jgi:hypothetical protein